MLSLCLPIYNSDVRPLVRGLVAEAATLPVPVELLLLDDGSREELRRVNAELAGLPGLRYEELPQNVGRAAIRNRLAERATQPYLIFMDSDMSLVGTGFLARYLTVARAGAQVACGGHVYDAQPPERARRLHWRYGHTRETPPLAQRQAQPHRAFKTSNFLVQRDLMLRIGFDERLRHYGHEDTLFGFRLAEAGIPIVQLDNPLRHDEVETNAEFLRKTELGLHNLHRMRQDFDLPPAFDESILLLRLVRRLEARRLRGLVRRLLSPALPPLRGWLLRGDAPLLWFNLYKLGVYLALDTPALAEEQ